MGGVVCLSSYSEGKGNVEHTDHQISLAIGRSFHYSSKPPSVEEMRTLCVSNLSNSTTLSIPRPRAIPAPAEKGPLAMERDDEDSYFQPQGQDVAN